ncbi:DsbE family thiol:disulfide interchange protein [Limimaricola litoreus]|uniref:DsbE family thiol:disulfide interchange protein n=1 Tax=Limimaricola litoreus TaxID=2955316 RepID=A0A9X2FYF4_9RHOB|nr:DsbE family thiol:disulfide interchange protein [Limimaricola litoreus]MCP1169793.1 DsbE family thiol:disulfide interchange protein [Limimaricola litoreus]
MARVSPLIILPPAIFAALAGLFAAGMLRDNPDELPSALIGREAPLTETGTLPGRTPFDPAVLADGKVKLVNFWASWCAPCRVEHPNFEALAQEGLPIYGINYKDDPDNAGAFLDELGDPYTAIGTDDGRVARDWGVYGVPETFVVDGEGRIIERMAGPVTQRAITARLRPALDEAAAR